MLNLKDMTFEAGDAVTNSPLNFASPGVNPEHDRYLAVRVKTGSWDAATLSVQVSVDNVTYYPLYVVNAYPGLAPLADEWRQFTVARMYQWIKLWSQNGSGVDVTQTDEVIIEVTYD